MAESIKETNTGNSYFDGAQELAKNIEGLNITDSNKVRTEPLEHHASDQAIGGPSEFAKNFKGSNPVRCSTQNVHDSYSLTYNGHMVGLPSAERSSNHETGHAIVAPGLQDGGADPPLQQRPEPDICSLDENDIDKLAQYLNPDKGSLIKNWSHLARELNIPENEREAMRRSYHGGGNPALEFFKSLKKRSDAGNIGKLIDKCREMQRNDCASYIEKNVPGKSMNISELSEDKLEWLACKLSEQGPIIIKTWRNLAALYNYRSEQIEAIANTVIVPNQYSPTHVVIKVIRCRFPELRLVDLMDKCEKIKRNDVKLALGEIRGKKLRN